MTTNTRTLQVLAALVWYIGGVVLLLKGGSLLKEATALQPDRVWPAFAIAASVLLGGLKGLLLFRKSCQKNLNRINDLERPKIWQFFSPRFFALLSLMIFAGASLSRMAHGQYGFLIGVGILDLSIATALLASSYVFWKRRV
jgi:hypothetical protein